MGIEEDRVVRNIDRCANTTAATIHIGLSGPDEQRRIRRGDLVLMASFGAGFAWGSVLTGWDFSPEFSPDSRQRILSPDRSSRP